MLILEIVDDPQVVWHNRLMIYYHVTMHSRVPKILRQGLTFGHRPQWRNAFSQKLGRSDRIYLFNDLDAAIQFASRLEWGLIRQNRKNSQVDILEIETDAPVQIDPSADAGLSQQAGKWFMTNHVIPPTAIKRIMPLTLEMKRDFIARRDGKA